MRQIDQQLRETKPSLSGNGAPAVARPRFDPTRIFVQKDRLVWFWFLFAMAVLLAAAVDQAARKVLALALDPFKQPSHIGNHRNTADFPVLRAGSGISQDRQFALFKIAIAPVDARGFTFSATTVGEKFNQVAAPVAVAAIGLADDVHKFQEILMAWQLKMLLPNAHSFYVSGRVVVPGSSFQGDIENQPERSDCVVEIGRTGLLCKSTGPLQAFGFRDVPYVRRFQFRPRFQKGLYPFAAIFLAAWFKRDIAVKPLLIRLERLLKCYFAAPAGLGGFRTATLLL